MMFGAYGGLTSIPGTIEILNGTATWVTRQLKYSHYYHAMVLLFCLRCHLHCEDDNHEKNI
jgi:hypothetical protein